MALSILSKTIRAFYINKHFLLTSVSAPHILHLSSTISEEQTADEATKKKKTVRIPKITLILADKVSVTTMEEAQKLSKRRDLKLVKIIDVETKTERPVYKLMTGSEYHAEELKARDQKKKEKLTDNSIKGEKVLMINAGIGINDLKVLVNKIMKWLSKRYEARIVINGDAANMEKAENIYKFMEEQLKEHGRFLQKRTKGSDIKFSINPPKKEKDKESAL